MNHRTVSELVEFYYNWKKTERYDNYLTQHKRRPLFMFDPNSSLVVLLIDDNYYFINIIIILYLL